MRQFPCNAVRSRCHVADLDSPRAAFRVDAAEPHMVFTRTIDLSLEACRQVFYRPTHES
jgi:hypothetical protein